MPQLDRGTVKERAARLRAKGAAAFAGHLASQRGARRKVLVEREGLGRTEHFTLAEVAGAPPGAVVAAVITGNTARALVAEAA
jgi:threonylcarbamoyladenosine tRNA methylthiotransferase MtaB